MARFYAMLKRAPVLGLVALVAGYRGAVAQEPASKPVAVTLDVGLMNAAGNTRVTTLNGAEKVAFKPTGSRWQFEEQANAVYGRTQDSVTAEQLKVTGRADYRVLAVFHLFVGGTYERNRFAGVGRRFESHFDRHWREGESRGTTLVVIGQGLERQTVSEALAVAAAVR